MKYYVFEITTGDNKIAGRGAYEYETEREAVASFHQKLATAMKSDLYDSSLVMAVDKEGIVIRREYYVKEVPELEPLED